MTTSGSFATFDLATLLEEAYERAGLEMRSGYDLRTGIRSFNFLMAEWANRGLNLWTIDEETVALVQGQGTYTLAANTIDVVEAVLRVGDGASQSDSALERISFSQYANVPNKNATGRPSSYYVTRGVDSTTVTMWFVPDQDYTLVYWRLRRMEAGGSVGNTPDVPFRFVPALVSGLAYMIAMKKNQALAPALKAVYDEAFELAADEDRDRASVFFFPDLG